MLTGSCVQFKAQINFVDICECDEEKELFIVIAARMNEGGCKRLQRLQRIPIPRHVIVRLLVQCRHTVHSNNRPPVHHIYQYLPIYPRSRGWKVWS